MKRCKLILILATVIFCLSRTCLSASERTVTFSQIEGKVMVKIGQSKWIPADKEMVLHQGDEIMTAKGSYAKILLDAGKTAEVEIRKNSHLRLDTMQISSSTGEKITLLDLALGSILIEVQKLEGASKFEVKTPTSIAGVRGTVFEVSVEQEE